MTGSWQAYAACPPPGRGSRSEMPDGSRAAKRVQVHPITIARLEAGTRQPSMALLQRLAKALGVPVSRLLE